MFGHRFLMEMLQRASTNAYANRVRVSGTVWAFMAAFALVSCENSKPADPLITHLVTVTDLNRDTLAVIPNEKLASEARIAIEETLSDTAIVWVSGDVSFVNPMPFLLPIGDMPLTSIGGLSGDSLYIRYEPRKKSISGALSIKITYLN